MKKVLLSSFAAFHQFMENLDPRAKILGIILSLCILTASRNGSPWLHLTNLLPALILAGFTQQHPGSFRRRLQFVSVFLLMAALFHLILLRWIPQWQQTGYHPFTFVLSTTLCGLFLGMFLTATTHPNAFTKGLIRMHIPAQAAWMLTLAYRYLPLIQSEVSTSFSAATLRGFRQSPRKHQVFAFLTAGIMQRAYAQAERTGDAMFLRGFDLTVRHVSSRSFTVQDIFFLLCLPLAFLLIRLVVS